MERKPQGFTLLEVLVATAIMAIAVTGLLTSLSTSLRNAARVTSVDRATLLARQKMDELLSEPKLPKSAELPEPKVDPSIEKAYGDKPVAKPAAKQEEPARLPPKRPQVEAAPAAEPR